MTLPEPRAATASRVRFGVLTFISSLSILTYLDRTCISRVQEDMKFDLALNDAQMGLVFGAFTIGYGIFEVPAGWMGDIWGTRRVLTRIVLWWSLFTALTGSIGWLTGIRDYRFLLFRWEIPLLFFLMLAVRFLFGCGEAGAYPNLARVVGTWFPFHERGFAQSAIWTFARLGGAIAPVLIGRLTGLIGWQQAFWVFGVVGLIWCFAFYSWFRNTPEEMPACNAAEREWIRGYTPAKNQSIASDVDPALAEAIRPDMTAVRADLPRAAAKPEVPLHAESGGLRPPLAPSLHSSHSLPPVGRLLATPTMWALCIASLFVNLAWYFFPTWQPRYFKDVFDISMEGSELLTGLPYLCGALGAFIGGNLSDRLIRITGSRRWGRSLVGLVGFGGAGLCAFCLLLVTQAWQAVLLLCLVFLINDLAVPVIWAASTDISGRFAGTISAVVNTAGCIGAFLGPVITGAMLDSAAEQGPRHGLWPLIFTGLASAWVIAGVSWLFVDAARPIVPADAAPKTS
jgi:ACS family glucarate transporter-like MFS transporter